MCLLLLMLNNIGMWLVDRYHLFGDTAHKAMLMESTGVPDAVHISEEAYLHIRRRQMESDQVLVTHTSHNVLCLCLCQRGKGEDKNEAAGATHCTGIHARTVFT